MKSRYSRILATTSMALILSVSSAQAQEAAKSDPNEVLSGLTRGQLDKMIENYILTHPEVIGQALMMMSQKQMEQDLKATELAIQAYQKELYEDEVSPSVGNTKADVKLVMFYDYNCPACKMFTSIISDLIKSDTNVRVIFKEYPITSPESEVAAKASIAFYRLKKDKFMEFHSESMKQMTMPDLSVMMDVASKLGVSTTALKNEMDSVEVSNQLDKVREMAQGLVINATPTLILGNEAISGVIPLEQLQAKIAKLREKKS